MIESKGGKIAETNATTRGLRWPWEKLRKAATSAEVREAISEAAAMLGTDDIQIRLSTPPQGYLRLMGDAWLAYKYGEIERPGSKALFDRALAVYSQLYLRALMRSRR